MSNIRPPEHHADTGALAFFPCRLSEQHVAVGPRATHKHGPFATARRGLRGNPAAASCLCTSQSGAPFLRRKAETQTGRLKTANHRVQRAISLLFALPLSVLSGLDKKAVSRLATRDRAARRRRSAFAGRGVQRLAPVFEWRRATRADKRDGGNRIIVPSETFAIGP